MTSTYVRVATPDQVWACLAELRARTVIFDVEPLVAFWDTDQRGLEDGIAAVLARVVDVGADSVLFATNSTRRPSTLPAAAWATVAYLASARKPFRWSPTGTCPARASS